MRHQPNPVLNQAEQALLDSEPEECFRHAVRRAAISLDKATTHLSPRIAAVVRCIVTGERPDAPDQPRPVEHSWERERAQKSLSEHPQLAQMLNERTLTADEAMQAAHAMDHILGRYTTGTRYAAP